MDIPPSRRLEPLDEAVVTILCDRVAAVAISPAVDAANEAFRRSRSPWDARKVARALAVVDYCSDPIVGELFDLAESYGLERWHG
jgi:hypothetical protein